MEPPAGLKGNDDDNEETDKTINLTIKSLKPVLTFTLPCTPTATIGSLKQQLANQDSSAPPAEQQRWILKGKAMASDRLLKDFAIEDGSVVNLMVSKPPGTASAPVPAAAPANTLSPAPAQSAKLSPPASPSSGPPPPERHTHRSVPSLTLSFSDAPSSGASAASSPGGEHPPSLNVVTSLPLDVDMQDASPMYEAPPFNAKVSDPALWTGAWELLQRHFGPDKEGEAQLAWEAWLAGSREYITPSDKALIRHKVGLSAMGGV